MVLESVSITQEHTTKLFRKIGMDIGAQTIVVTIEVGMMDIARVMMRI